MKTAVEWLVEQMLINNYITQESIERSYWLVNGAKEMEKEYNKLCCMKTLETCDESMEELGFKTLSEYFEFIYNETYKNTEDEA